MFELKQMFLLQELLAEKIEDISDDLDSAAHEMLSVQSRFDKLDARLKSYQNALNAINLELARQDLSVFATGAHD